MCSSCTVSVSVCWLNFPSRTHMYRHTTHPSCLFVNTHIHTLSHHWRYSQAFMGETQEFAACQTESRAQPGDDAPSDSHSFQGAAPSIWYLCSCSYDALHGAACVCVKSSASAGVQVWNNWIASSMHSRRYLSMPAAEALILYTYTPLLSAASFTPSLGNSPTPRELTSITSLPLELALIAQTAGSCRAGPCWDPDYLFSWAQ